MYQILYKSIREGLLGHLTAVYSWLFRIGLTKKSFRYPDHVSLPQYIDINIGPDSLCINHSHKHRY